ncbi:MAG: hypothetical protein K6F05_04565 [Succinivibrio sp.]|nr:hypothetical protein [Succinivibrio sp.]
MKIRCEIKGLDCPHCAAKLEQIYQQEFGGASLNFSLSSLVLDASEDADEDEVVERAQRLADSFEEGITVELRD